MPDRQRTAGQWSLDEGPLYFMASSQSVLATIKETHPCLLVAVNEINSENDEDWIDEAIEAGCRVFIDSGVFSTAMEHAKKHGLSHDSALMVPLADIDGYPALREKYVRIARKFQDRAWGVVEIDLGGREQKIITRAGLEAEGIFPIPVFHPLNDGLEYFKFLAERYERFCCGNFVNAMTPVRTRLLYALAELRLSSPPVWIHALGLSPGTNMWAMPTDSYDSSSWMAARRYAQGYVERAAMRSLGRMPRTFRYRRGDRDSAHATDKMGAYGFGAHASGLVAHRSALQKESLL